MNRLQPQLTIPAAGTTSAVDAPLWSQGQPNHTVSDQRIAIELKLLTVRLLVLLAATFILQSSLVTKNFATVCGIPSMLLGLILAWSTYRIVRGRPLMLWTPFPWFLISSALFYGLGPLAIIYGTDETVAYLMYVPFDTYDFWRASLLNIASVLVVSISFMVAARHLNLWQPVAQQVQTARPNEKSVVAATILFLCVGIPIKYLLSLPYLFGFTSFTLPGSIYLLSQLTTLGVIMLGYNAGSRPGWQFAFYAFTFTEFFVALLSFAKSEMLMAIMAAVLGRFLATRNIKLLVCGALFCALVYWTIKPVVSWSRIELLQQVGNIQQMTLPDRLTVLRRGIDEWVTRGSLHTSDLDEGWLRLCYTPVQTYAMNLRDRGVECDSMALALYAFVPRIIMPRKPIITEVAIDFTELYLGHRESSTGLGVFAEAYWNGGGLMVILICGYMGVLFAVLSRVALNKMAKQAWLFFPCVLLGIKMGYRTDGWFVADYLGPVVIYAAYYFCISLLYPQVHENQLEVG